jgi:hypothetical protein
MANGDSIKQRVATVLDYDSIPEKHRAAHLSKITGLSLTTGRRMMGDDPANKRRMMRYLFDLAKGLNVNWCWLYEGKFSKFDPRTARIQLVMLDGEAPSIADAIIDSVSCQVPGEPDYVSVGNNGVDLGRILLVEQHRRLSKWQQTKNFRFIIRLVNNDPKADRLLEMYSRGQITRQQVFQMV